MSFERRFHVWRYAVSHSELKLRSVDSESAPDLIEVTFFGVVGMKLKESFKSLTISYADESQAAEILDLVGIEESKRRRLKCYALKSDGGDCLVAAVGSSIWSHPRGKVEAEPKSEVEGSVLILRG